jgi:hypothetical protein
VSDGSIRKRSGANEFAGVKNEDLLRLFREECKAEHWRRVRIIILEIERRRIGHLVVDSKRVTTPVLKNFNARNSTYRLKKNSMVGPAQSIPGCGGRLELGLELVPFA